MQYSLLMRLPRPNNALALAYLLLVGGALVVGVYLSLSRWWPLAALLLGIVYWHAFVILHAAGHGAFFTSPLLNHVIGRLMSPLCTLPFSMWRFLHHQHHRWSGWRDLDPTLNAADKPRPEWMMKIMDLCWRFWIPVFSLAYMASTFWDPRQIKHFKSSGQKFWALFDVFLLCTMFLTLILYFGKAFWGAWLPGYLVFLSLADLSVLCQHIHLPHEVSHGCQVQAFSLSEQESYARELRAPGWMEWLIFGNFNRHASHHRWPRLAPYHAHHIPGSRVHEASAWQWLVRAKKMKMRTLLQEPSEQ